MNMIDIISKTFNKSKNKPESSQVEVMINVLLINQLISLIVWKVPPIRARQYLGAQHIDHFLVVPGDVGDHIFHGPLSGIGFKSELPGRHLGQEFAPIFGERTAIGLRIHSFSSLSPSSPAISEKP
jgi:hypothetical protein